MTAPAPEPLAEDPATREIAVLLAGLLAAGTTVAATAAARRALLATFEATRIVAVLVGLGVDRDVATATLALTLRRSPLPGTNRVAPPGAPARRQVQLVNLQRRAAYTVAAARRVHDHVARHPAGPLPTRPLPPVPDTGRGFYLPPAPSPGLPRTAPGRRRLPDIGPAPDTVLEPERRRRALHDALEQERRHWAQHAAAAAARNQVARDVDALATRHGDTLRWVAIRDAKTSKYCLRADGRLFLASRVPPLGFPGTVHPSCRCRPSAPGTVTARDRWVYDVPPVDEH